MEGIKEDKDGIELMGKNKRAKAGKSNKVQRLRCEGLNEGKAEEVKTRRAGAERLAGPGTDTVFGNKKWRLQVFV